MSAAAAFAASRKSRIGGYGGYRRSSYQDSDDDGPNMCWVVLFGVCGIALLGSGAWYAYDSFDDPRLVAIKPYNEAVDAWNNQKRSVFADSVFEWRLVSPLPEPVTIEGADGQTNTVDRFKEVDPKSPEAKAVPWTGMAQVKVVEPLAHDQSLEGIHTYEPLRWVGSGVLPAAPPGHLEEQDGVIKWSGAEYQLQLRATTKSGKSSVFNVEPIEPMKEVAVAANTKMCRIHHHNNFHNGRCWDRVAISQVCMRLAHTLEGGWGAPADGVSRGCAAGAELSFGRSCPGAGYSSHGLGAQDPGCDFSHVNFTVRSMDDPHIIAMSLTDSTLNFGNTPHENWVTGILMMCVGGVLLCPVAPIVFYKVCKRRSRYIKSMRSDSIFDAPRAARYNQRTVGHSPSPSRDSMSTEDDFRVDVHSSRVNSPSPHRRRGGSKDRTCAPSGVEGPQLYGVQASEPGGQVDVGFHGQGDVEMSGLASVSPTAPRQAGQHYSQRFQ